MSLRLANHLISTLIKIVFVLEITKWCTLINKKCKEINHIAQELIFSNIVRIRCTELELNCLQKHANRLTCLF